MFRWALTLLAMPAMAYVAWRAATVPWLAKRMAKRTLWGSIACLWGLMAAGRYLDKGLAFPVRPGWNWQA